MIIRYIDKSDPGAGFYRRDGKYVYASWIDMGGEIQGKYRAKEIVVNKSDPHWKMAFCHELGHALDHTIKGRGIFDPPIIELRAEIKAWRIAKTFCKDKYWDEDDAIYTIRVWAEFVEIKVNWDKFKVVPLIQGKRKVRK